MENIVLKTTGVSLRVSNTQSAFKQLKKLGCKEILADRIVVKPEGFDPLRLKTDRYRCFQKIHDRLLTILYVVDLLDASNSRYYYYKLDTSRLKKLTREISRHLDAWVTACERRQHQWKRHLRQAEPRMRGLYWKKVFDEIREDSFSGRYSATEQRHYKAVRKLIFSIPRFLSHVWDLRDGGGQWFNMGIPHDTSALKPYMAFIEALKRYGLQKIPNMPRGRRGPMELEKRKKRDEQLLLGTRRYNEIRRLKRLWCNDKLLYEERKENIIKSGLLTPIQVEWLEYRKYRVNKRNFKSIISLEIPPQKSPLFPSASAN